jgi:hypothetical protein
MTWSRCSTILRRGTCIFKDTRVNRATIQLVTFPLYSSDTFDALPTAFSPVPSKLVASLNCQRGWRTLRIPSEKPSRREARIPQIPPLTRATPKKGSDSRRTFKRCGSQVATRYVLHPSIPTMCRWMKTRTEEGARIGNRRWRTGGRGAERKGGG